MATRLRQEATAWQVGTAGARPTAWDDVIGGALPRRRYAVELVDGVIAGSAVLEAAVLFVADGAREADDSSIAGHEAH
jgi:hypothetical protein